MAKILYLEDAKWQVEGTVVTYMEKELKHAVTLVASIDEAVEELSTSSYDVVFLDIMMDDWGIEFEDSGLRVAERIREGEFAEHGNPAPLPIVIASGVWDATVKDTATGTRRTVKDRALALGIPETHFLYKPFVADEIQQVLWACLDPHAGCL